MAEMKNKRQRVLRAARPLPEPSVAGDSGEWIVWGVALMQVALLWFYFVRYAAPLPWDDDYCLVGGLRASGPSEFLTWVMQPHNEHRIPLIKLVLWAFARLTHWNARVPLLASSLAIAGSGLFALWCLRRRWGRLDVCDLALPLSYISLAHWFNLMMGVQIYFTFAAALYVVALGIVALAPTVAPRSAAIAGGTLMLLATMGPVGAVLSLPLAAWLFASSWWGGRERIAGTVLNGSAVALALLAIIFTRSVGNHPPSGGLLADAATALTFLAGMWGTIAREEQQPTMMLATGSTLAGLLIWWGGSLWRSRHAAREWPLGVPAPGLLAGMLGPVALAAAIGHGRSGFGYQAGLAFHYVTLSLLFFVALWLALRSMGGNPVARGVLTFLAALVIGLTPINGFYAMRLATDKRERLEVAIVALRDSADLDAAIERHGALVYPADGMERLRPWIHYMREESLAIFRHRRQR